jgi:hypothetical protein
MTDQRGYSMIILVIAILAISAISFGVIKIYKDKIEASLSDIFKISNTETEQSNIENLVFMEPQSETVQANPVPKTDSCKTEANQNVRQYLKNYEEQLKADWPNYLGATYDDFLELYSDPNGNKYVSDPQTRISMAETALKSAQQTIKEKLSEVQAVVYPQYLQECLNK